jgi:hypothetical protein
MYINQPKIDSPLVSPKNNSQLSRDRSSRALNGGRNKELLMHINLMAINYPIVNAEIMTERKVTPQVGRIRRLLNLKIQKK